MNTESPTRQERNQSRYSRGAVTRGMAWSSRQRAYRPRRYAWDRYILQILRRRQLPGHASRTRPPTVVGGDKALLEGHEGPDHTANCYSGMT
jgi:hypothetical protein